MLDELLLQANELLGINTTGDLLDPRFDYVFKRIFTADQNESKQALRDFLNGVLFNGNDTIKELEVINNEIPVDDRKYKKSRFDIRIIFNNGEQAVVEMEFNPKDDFFKRSIYEISKVYSSQEISGLDFRKLDKCYLVCVMGYNLWKTDSDYTRTFTFKDEKCRQLSDDVQIVYLELEKVEVLLNKTVTELTNAEMWGIFLKYASYSDKREVLGKIAELNGGIKMAVELLSRISKDKQERIAYENQLIAEIDHQAEISYAEKKGRREIACELLKIAMPLNDIVKITKLTEREILELQN